MKPSAYLKVSAKGDRIMERNWNIRMPYRDRDVAIETTDTSITVDIRDARYTVVVARLSLDAVGDRFYTLSASVEATGLSFRPLYLFRDAEGRELAKGYFMEGRRVVSPPDTATVEVEALVTSEGQGRLSMKDILLCDGGAYEPRTARVVAMSSFVTAKPDGGWFRSYETSVAETLASIDLVAEREHPDMIVLTENVFQTRLPSAEYRAYPNRLDGTDPTIVGLCERARKYRTYITCSVFEVDGEGMRHNTGLLIDREGEIAGIYRKCQLTIGEIEGGLRPGDALAVFDTDFARIGIQICWDHYFPESTRVLAMKGAELICVPTHGSHIERAVTRAEENGVWLAIAHTSREVTFITAPGATKLLDTGEEKGYAVADIDFNAPERRRYLSCDSYGASYEYYMCERRPDLYGDIGKRMK